MAAPLMNIEVANLVVARGSVRGVDGVSLSIPSGSWLGLIGANGSGKTSLLRGIAGRLEVSSGDILVDGVDRTEDRAWRARAFGFAPEGSVLPDALSPYEYFQLVEEKRGGWKDARLAGLRGALDFDSFLHRGMGSLSAGMRQRIAIYSAFLAGGDTIFLDEPFNWLDPVCAFDTKAALAALVREAGLTLVTALHDTATLTLRCDAGALMSQGRLPRYFSSEELRRGASDLATFEAQLIASLRQP